MVVDEHRGSAFVVTACRAPSAVACLRSLGGRGVRSIVAFEHDHTPAIYSRYCDEAVRVPDPHENLQAFAQALLGLAKRPAVETIIPVRDVDVYVLAKYRDRFADHVATPWPSLETLRVVHDRIELFEVASEAGVSAPETQLLTASLDWDRKWIVKARYALLVAGYLGHGDDTAYETPPTTEYLPPGVEPDLETLCRRMGHRPLAQAYVPVPDEYGFFALYDQGEPVATFQHRQLRGYTYAGGASAYRESVHIPALERAGRRLLDTLEWHGLAMVEFLRDEDGTFKLMEVNPRFWSSLPFSVQAGADFPLYYWHLATGNRTAIDDGYEVGLAGHLLRGELLYLRSIRTQDLELATKPSFPRALWEVCRTIATDRRFDYASLADPKPFVRDLYNAYDEYKTRGSVSTDPP